MVQSSPDEGHSQGPPTSKTPSNDPIAGKPCRGVRIAAVAAPQCFTLITTPQLRKHVKRAAIAIRAYYLHRKLHMAFPAMSSFPS
jgi:hypothetical protein